MSEVTSVTRRRLLGNTARATAAALAAELMPPNVRRALAAGAPAGSLRDVKHVVLLMQENRSFDHYFGTMAGVRGFDDAHAMKLAHGKSVFHQPDPQSHDGYLLPFHLDTKTTSAQKVVSTSHAWAVQHAAWNEGKMDGWMTAHRKADGPEKAPMCMGYYKREDIPFQFALAEAFTICDAYHCSVMGPTWPNRLYWMTASIDPDGRHGGPVIRNKDNNYSWTTYAERLEAAGVSWFVYNQSEDPDDPYARQDTPSQTFPFNMLAHFKQYKESPADSPLRRKAMTPDNEAQFFEDARNDKLATVSWIMPPRYASEHPDHMPAAGAAFVSRVIDALAANPKVWAKTALIINYDENDGIFDHFPPPTPPPGTPLEFIKGLPIGGGFRVPCIIVSPWTAGGWVCSERFDHTSVLQFLEKLTGVHDPNITDWRRKTFGDLTSAFRFHETPAQPPASLPNAAERLAAVQLHIGQLPVPRAPGSGEQVAPVQEKGQRRRTP